MKKLLLLSLLFTASYLMTNAQVTVMSIDSARAVNASGVPIYNGQHVQVSGIVYGPNTFPLGAGFVLFSHSGITVASYNDTYNYTVTDGDSVVVIGTVFSYHGEQLITLDNTDPNDTIYKVGTGQVLPPLMVNVIDESTESELIEVQNVDMSVASGWGPVGGNSNFTAFVGLNPNTYYVYIDSLVSPALFSWPQPHGYYNIVGFGYQFAGFSPPYRGGYEIMPRGISDFIPVSTTATSDIIPLQAKIYPNPGKALFTVFLNDNSVMDADINVMDIAGRVVLGSHQAVEGNKLTVHAQNLTAGIYLLEIRSGLEVFRNKIVVEK